MSKDKRVDLVKQHYNAVADEYSNQYDSRLLMDLAKPYPANYFRLQKLLQVCKDKEVRVALEVGVGDGTPLAALAENGIDVWGFDLADEMIKKAQHNIASVGGNREQIILADIEDNTTYKTLVKDICFDAVIAMGVMPHVEDDITVLQNITNLVRQGGTVFVEFRNKLFSLFTFNRNTVEFLMDDLLVDCSGHLKDLVYEDLSKRLRMDMPPIRDKVENSAAPGYDAILSKYHNPIELVDLFGTLGYKKIKLHWYHYHPTMPYLESVDSSAFRQQAIAMEHEMSGWRGYFLASAFVIEAIKE